MRRPPPQRSQHSVPRQVVRDDYNVSRGKVARRREAQRQPVPCCTRRHHARPPHALDCKSSVIPGGQRVAEELQAPRVWRQRDRQPTVARQRRACACRLRNRRPCEQCLVDRWVPRRPGRRQRGEQGRDGKQSGRDRAAAARAGSAAAANRLCGSSGGDAVACFQRSRGSVVAAVCRPPGAHDWPAHHSRRNGCGGRGLCMPNPGMAESGSDEVCSGKLEALHHLAAQPTQSSSTRARTASPAAAVTRVQIGDTPNRFADSNAQVGSPLGAAVDTANSLAQTEVHHAFPCRYDDDSVRCERRRGARGTPARAKRSDDEKRRDRAQNSACAPPAARQVHYCQKELQVRLL